MLVRRLLESKIISGERCPRVLFICRDTMSEGTSRPVPRRPQIQIYNVIQRERTFACFSTPSTFFGLSHLFLLTSLRNRDKVIRFHEYL